jgi:hypothetical protein
LLGLTGVIHVTNRRHLVQGFAALARVSVAAGTQQSVSVGWAISSIIEVVVMGIPLLTFVPTGTTAYLAVA